MFVVHKLKKASLNLYFLPAYASFSITLLMSEMTRGRAPSITSNVCLIMSALFQEDIEDVGLSLLYVVPVPRAPLFEVF